VHADTVYSAQQGFGWVGSHPQDARDHESPDSLVGHFVRCTGNGDTFAVDVPNGDYGVYTIIDGAQYWDYMAYSKRSIEAQGKEALSESSPPEQFIKEIFFKHENDEDLPGTDIWERYVRGHFRPKMFTAHVTDGQLKITYKGDPWGLMLSTLV